MSTTTTGETLPELVDRRIRLVLKRTGKPWDRVAQGDRDSIASILRKIATEVEDGGTR